jgi:hypothetical protein
MAVARAGNEVLINQ